jgi:hypothetical protein
VSNNVGIDFTKLGPPYGTKPEQAAQKEQGSTNEKQDELISIGFRLKPKEKAIIQDYINRMYNPFVVDSNTKEPKNVELSLQQICNRTRNFFIDDHLIGCCSQELFFSEIIL